MLIKDMSYDQIPHGLIRYKNEIWKKVLRNIL